jgi:predicted alpha/beta-hydrolase family hydrolase
MVAIDRRDAHAGDPGRRKSLSADESLNRTALLSGQRSTEHRPLIRVPTGFTHGTADPFGSIDELRAASALIPAPIEIVEVTGARHNLGSKTLDVPVLAVDAALRLLP